MRFAIIILAFALLVTARAQAAENVYLSLKSDGSEIKGESSVKTLGRADTIECVSYDQSVDAIGGKLVYQPLTITKRIDKSSPLLFKSMLENGKIDAIFKFFRPNPVTESITQQFYTVRLSNARIISIHQIVPDTRDKASATMPPSEEIKFSFGKIEWTYNDGGITSQDDAVQMAGSSAATGARPILRLPRNN